MVEIEDEEFLPIQNNECKFRANIWWQIKNTRKHRQCLIDFPSPNHTSPYIKCLHQKKKMFASNFKLKLYLLSLIMKRENSKSVSVNGILALETPILKVKPPWETITLNTFCKKCKVSNS